MPLACRVHNHVNACPHVPAPSSPPGSVIMAQIQEDRLARVGQFQARERVPVLGQAVSVRPCYGYPGELRYSPMGYEHSILKRRSGAPRQGWEGASNARPEIDPAFVQGLEGIQSGQDI